MCTRNSQSLLVYLSFPILPNIGKFFEITKEGTESILIKWNTFQKATLEAASAKSRKLE